MAPTHLYPGWQQYYPPYFSPCSFCTKEDEIEELTKQVELLQERVEELLDKEAK